MCPRAEGFSYSMLCADEDEYTDRKAITSVQVCVNSGVVVGLALSFTDQSLTGWRGSGNGTIHTFDLNDTEDITTISYIEENDRLLGLSFTTSKGSPPLLHCL